MLACLRRVPAWVPTAFASVSVFVGGAALVDYDHREAPMNLGDRPAYFRADGATAFRATSLETSDVVLVSYPKCGTSWIHSVVFALLRMDDDGVMAGSDGECGAKGQVYPDGIREKRNTMDPKGCFGGWCFDDLLAQRRPRLFTSHIGPAALPSSLSERGRFVIFARDPKDALVSGYFFVEELDAKPIAWLREWHTDGMQGYYTAFLVEKKARGDGSYGDYYTWHRDTAALGDALGDRAYFCFFEAFACDFDGEAQKLSAFLGVPLPPRKLAALRAHAAFGGTGDGTSSTMIPTVATQRLGVVGDHQRHLTASHWIALDRLFKSRLGDSASLAPLAPLIAAAPKAV